MKTGIKKLNLIILLTGIVILSSCSNRTAMGTALGIRVICHSLPAVAATATQYSKHIIAEYLKNSAVVKNDKVTTGKKAEKKSVTPKIKPVSIGVVREVRLV